MSHKLIVSPRGDKLVINDKLSDTGKNVFLYNGCYNGNDCIVRFVNKETNILPITHPMLKLEPDIKFFNPVLVSGDIDTDGEFWVYNVPQRTLSTQASSSDDKTVQKHYVYQIAQFIQFLNQNGISVGTIKLNTCFVCDDHSIVVIALPSASQITSPDKNNHHLNVSLPPNIRIQFGNDIIILGVIYGFLLTGYNPIVRRYKTFKREYNRVVNINSISFTGSQHLPHHDQRRLNSLLSSFPSKRQSINDAVRDLFTILQQPHQKETIDVELDGTECVVPEL